MKDTIWYKDLSGFITADNYLEFFPLGYMSLEQRLNSIIRFALYLSIVLIPIKRNLNIIYILLISMALSYIFYNELANDDDDRDKARISQFYPNNKKSKSQSQSQSQPQPQPQSQPQCSNLDKENTFGNTNSIQNSNELHRKKSCYIDKKSLIDITPKHLINTNDIYNPDFSNKVLYTNPSNEQDEYIKFLYGN